MSTIALAGRRRRSLGTGARWAFIFLVGLVMAAPLLYLVSASLMSQAAVRDFPPHLLPPDIVWHNYKEAWDFLTVRVIINSVVFSVGIVVVQLALTLPAGFALAAIPFRWTGVVLAVVVVPMLIPSNMTLIPLYIVTHELGLIGTYPGMILPIAGQTAFAMLLFRRAFADLPAGLFEAARIDGAGWFRTLAFVAVPLIKPALAAYCSISFLTAWNTYIWPQVVAPDEAHRVLTVALAPLASGQYSLFSPSVGLAASVISIAPVLAIFSLFQKWFIKGIVGTGVD